MHEMTGITSGIMTGRFSSGPSKPCRECKHNDTGHFKRYDNPLFKCVHCECLDYVPAENLDYLVWLHEKKTKHL